MNKDTGEVGNLIRSRHKTEPFTLTLEVELKGYGNPEYQYKLARRVAGILATNLGHVSVSMGGRSISP